MSCHPPAGHPSPLICHPTWARAAAPVATSTAAADPLFPAFVPPPCLCQGDSQAVVTQVSLRRCGGAVKAQMLFRRAVTLIDQLEHFECVLVPR